MASTFVTHAARLSAGAAACFIAAAGYGQNASQPFSPNPTSQTQSTSSGTPARTADASGDIVVTAQRREQRLQDVPISVSVTSGETVTKTGIRDLADLAARVPGIRIGTNTLSDSLNIRGIGSGVNAGFEQSVGTFVDGVYRGRSRVSRASLFDVERVEVLKGPQTTFFGNNTIAGALNITSRKPSQTFGYNATALYAPTDDEYIAEAGVTGRLTDSLSARGAIKFSGMSGYIYNNYTKQDEPHLRDIIGRISLRWEPNSTFRSDLRVDRARNRDRGTYSAEIRGCPPGSEFGSVPRGSCALYLTQKGGTIDSSYNWKSDVPPSFFRLDLNEAAWTNNLDLGLAELTSITSYFHDRTSTLLQAQAVPVPGVGGTISRSPFENQERYTNYSQELRLESRGSHWLQYVVGGYYSHGDLTNNSYSSLYGVPTVGAAGAPVTDVNTPIGTLRNLYQIDQTRSIFGQLTARMTSSLRASAALRYTSVKKKGHRTFFTGIGSATPGPNGFVYLDNATEAKLIRAAGGSKADFADPHTTYNELMPAFNVQYDIVPTMTGYASYTKGFKAGGYSDSNTPVQFKSEVADAYEVGIKGSFLDRKIFFTLDAFYGKYGNLQEALTSVGPTGTFITTVGNAAKAVSKGIEFSTTAKATSLISFNLEGTYNDAKYRDYKNGQCGSVGTFQLGASCVQDLSGRPRAYAPKWTGSIGADIGMPIGATRILRFVPSAYYSSSYFLTPQIDPLLKQHDFATFDMRVAYGLDGGRWEVAVIGKNLTNAHVQDTAIALGTAAGTTQAILRRARSIAFSFSIKQ